VIIKLNPKLWLLLFISFVLLNRNGIAQNNQFSANSKQLSADSSITSVWEDFKIGVHTGTQLISSPAHFETKDWIYGGLAVAATGVTFLIDNDFRNSFKKNHSSVLDNFADVGYNYGNALYAVAFSSAVYLGGKIFREEKYSTTGRMLLEGLLYAGITTSVLKTIIGRSRPYTEDGPSQFNGFQIKAETTSLPSGHVTVAFAMSSVLAERIDNVYASVLLYSLAGSTVFQRIYDDKHWASDTILAAVIGYTIGKAVVKLDSNQKLNNVSVSTYYLPNGAGLNLKFSF
jgi:hypothetical protein